MISRFSHPVRLEHLSMRITISIGVAIARPGEEYESVLARADASVYKAKEAGGNQFVIDAD
ncbi:MAG: diguanylate cyclase [Actinobacteria bacterium]|nr:diguanylate cyclase [Actinomycetota bacterium]